MKIKLLCFSIFLAIGVTAQQAGKVGEKIPNEVNNTIQNKKGYETTKKRGSGKEYNNPRGGNQNGYQPQYHWNQSYSKGYAEVFIRIPEGGLFTLALDDQELTTPIGMFRFFDVVPGQNLLKIYQNGRLMYQTKMQVDNNKRLILDYFSYEGLYLLKSISLNPRNNQANYYEVWNDTWNDSYQSNLTNDYQYWNQNVEQSEPHHNYNPQQTQNNHSYGVKPMSSQDFEQFKSAVKQQSFEDTKLQMIKTQPINVRYTAQQIKELMGLFNFDDNRLEVGKYCYDLCIDPQNYYITYNALTYDSSKNELMDYVSGRK